MFFLNSTKFIQCRSTGLESIRKGTSSVSTVGQWWILVGCFWSGCIRHVHSY